jgi:hypothetical protein
MDKPYICCCPYCHALGPKITEYVVYRLTCDACGTHTNKGNLDEIVINWNEGRTEDG